MEEPLRILLISNLPQEADLLAKEVQKFPQETATIVQTVGDAIREIRGGTFQVVLCDITVSEEGCLEILSELKRCHPRTAFVLLSDSKGVVLAEKLLKEGVYHYFVKREELFEELPRLIQGVWDRFELTLREHKLEEEVAKQQDSLNAISERLESVSIYDELTKVFNHRYFQESLSDEFLRAKRYAHPLSCLLLDIDYFKSVNETRGHVVGDEVLKALGQLLIEATRKTDVVARYGGEEFAILLPHIDYEGATVFADRVRKQISDEVFLAGRFDLRITVSIGVASYPDDALQKCDDLILFSEKALLHAKGNHGRNSVYCYAAMMKEMESQMPVFKFSEDKVAEFRKRLLDVSESAKRAYIESTKALVYAIEAKDKFTLGHASRVAQYSALVAREISLPDEEVTTIEHAGLLHDVGKVCISDEILLKQGPLTLAEFEKMKEHATFGYQVIKPIKFLKEEALIILHHHECFNGQGYPHKLKSKEIPIGARIVSVLDAYDTMRVSGARYKKTLNAEQAVEELINHAGRQFDPEVVSAFVRVLVKRGEITEFMYNKEKLREAIESCKQ